MSNLKKDTLMSYSKQLEWLKANAKYLSISAVEESVGCPATTINKFVTGERRNFPKKWIEPLAKWIDDFRK